ncbi:MAG: hypothetical protein JWP57_4247 [Spirosoma sp.]|nr:hypothetical protein [Spirosoma sp.]
MHNPPKNPPPPAPANPKWFVAPFYSRGSFSPRLLMAWVTLFFSFWLAVQATAPAVLLGTQVVQPSPLLFELVAVFVALIGSLLALGTLQKLRLEGPPPAPENQTVIGQGAIGQQNVAKQQPQPGAADSIPLPTDNE